MNPLIPEIPPVLMIALAMLALIAKIFSLRYTRSWFLLPLIISLIWQVVFYGIVTYNNNVPFPGQPDVFRVTQAALYLSLTSIALEPAMVILVHRHRNRHDKH